MSDLVTAWIRTITPGIVAVLLTWATKAGLDIDGEALLVVINGIILGAWYLLSRYLEKVLPWVPWNGVKSTPKY